MLTQAKLAEFYNTSDRSVRRWSAEEKHRKTIQAEADVTPQEWQLVGEIAQLCYLYNAQNWVCETPTKWVWFEINSLLLSVSFFDGMKGQAKRIMQANVSSVAEMQLIKMQLERLVYGEGK